MSFGQAKLHVAELPESMLQSSLEEERLARLETVAGDTVIAAHVELMQKFKDGKSSK